MMKRFCFALALVFVPMFLSAYDFLISGVAYKILSVSDLECEVTAGCVADNNGKLTIPGTVDYKGRTFKVLGIADKPFSSNIVETGTVKQLTIMDGPTYIGEGAFQLQQIDEIRIPKTVVTIKSSSFGSNKWRYPYQYSSTVVYDPCRLIIEDSEELLSYHVENVFLDGPFTKCNFTYLYLGRSINNDVFHYPYCTVEEFVIGDIVKELRSEAIPNSFLRNVKKITIGKGLEMVPYMNEGDKLEAIYVRSQTPQESLGFNDATMVHTTLYVPQGTKEAYMNAPVWKNFWTIEEYQPSELTSVSQVNATKVDDNVIYDLAGRRVKEPQTGFYIKGNKKYFKK